MPRRRRRAGDYPVNSVFGDPARAEKLALGMARVEFGELSEREQRIVIATARVFMGRCADLEQVTDELQEKVLELYRIAAFGAA